MMLTGDHKSTAQSVAEKVGFLHTDIILEGREIDAMSDEVLLERMDKTNIFARVTPEDKLRIGRLLRESGAESGITSCTPRPTATPIQYSHPLRCRYDVGRVSTRGDDHQSISGSIMDFQLANEHRSIAVVICRRCHCPADQDSA